MSFSGKENKILRLRSVCSCLHSRFIENGHTRNPRTLSTRPERIPVQVWVHMLGDHQECSAEERYNNDDNIGQAFLLSNFKYFRFTAVNAHTNHAATNEHMS